jgi:polysaccharide export outer membrane protein
LRSQLLPGALLLVTGLALGGCASLGTYTWYSEVPANEWSAAPGEYVIAVGDTITIKVQDQDNLSAHGKIRSDGRLAMALAGEVIAAGKTPAALAKEVEARLKEFIVSPRVIVNVDESVPITISVLGEVGNRGTLTLTQPASLIQVLAQAGGPGEFADRDAIFLVRQKPTFRRIRFTYDALLTNKGGAATFQVRSGDVIVVQ